MHKLNLLKKQKGFTLLELMVSIVIISLVVLGLNTLFISGYNQYILGNDKAKIQRNIRLIDKIMNNNIRYGESIKVIDQTKPQGESIYDHVLELVEGGNNANTLLYNGRKVTDSVILDMTNIHITNTKLEITFEFIDGTEITMNTILNNID